MIEFLPESQKQLLVAKMLGRLTVEDYEQILIPKLDEIIGEYQKVRAVIIVDESFTGWELGALWEDAKYGLKHRHDFDKIAMVGASHWLEKAVKLGSVFIDSEVKTFDVDKLSDALVWINESEK